MRKRKTVPFIGTKEQEKELRSMISEMKTTPDALIPIMQYAQDIYGYLPVEVQRIIASELKVTLEEVYGATTYYSGFRLNPQGKYRLTVCMGTGCRLNGADEIYERLTEVLGIEENECTEDRLFSMETRHCVGACAIGPVLVINDKVYGNMNPDKAVALIEQCKKEVSECIL